MLTYTFENRGEKPYYQYLYECLRHDIEQGELPAGTKLPSKRSFARQLGLSVMTIESAYEQLMVEGYIYAEEKRGYFVSEMLGQMRYPMQQERPLYQMVQNDSRQQWRMDFASNQLVLKMMSYNLSYLALYYDLVLVLLQSRNLNAVYKAIYHFLFLFI